MDRCIVWTGITLIKRIIVTLFSRTVRPRRLKLGTHFHFAFSPIFKHEKFSSHFPQELWGLEDWNLVHSWTVCRCFMFTGIRLLLLICPFISEFSFLSNSQTLKVFVTIFSGTVRPRRLKLSTHVDSGQMYHVYRNQAAATYLSLYFFIFLSNFPTLKVFITLFSGALRPRRLNLVHTWIVGRCIVYTWIRLLLFIDQLWKSGAILDLPSPSVILSFRNLSDENFRHTFLRNCEA